VPTDGNIDFTRYSDYDLLAAADHIDASHYPQNSLHLNSEIDRRGIRGKDIPSPQAAQDARDAADIGNSTSIFSQVLNGAVALVLIALGARGLLGNDLVLMKARGSESQVLHLHGLPAVVGGSQMLLGGGLLTASLLVYALDGHRYTPLYMWLARLGRYVGIPLIVGGALLRYL
jgi:hypothetical protein